MERHTMLLGSLDIKKVDSFKSKPRDFPGGPMAKTLNSQCRGLGLIPGQGAGSHMPQLKIPHATTKA